MLDNFFLAPAVILTRIPDLLPMAARLVIEVK